VGDTYFQHKSFARIKEFRKAGTSIIMVSHSKESVQELCERAILLEGGKIKSSNRLKRGTLFN